MPININKEQLGKMGLVNLNSEVYRCSVSVDLKHLQHAFDPAKLVSDPLEAQRIDEAILLVREYYESIKNAYGELEREEEMKNREK